MNTTTVHAGMASKAATQFRTGVALAVAGTFLFALKSIFIKLAFADGATPVPLLLIRMVFSLPFYIGMLWYLAARRGPSTQEKLATAAKPRLVAQAFFLGFLGYYLASYLDLSGLQRISAQLERLTLFTYPTMVALLAWLCFGEVINRRIVAAIFLSYVGIFVMYRTEQALSASGSDVALGILLVLGSALSYSLYVVFAKATMRLLGSRAFTSWAMIGSTFFVSVHFLLAESIEALSTLPWSVYAYGLILAFVCTVIPSFMINEAIVKLGATRTTVIGSAGPAFTMALAIIVLQEPSSWQHFVGMGVVILGVSLVAKR